MASGWPGDSSGSGLKKAQFVCTIVNNVIREIGANCVGSAGLKHRCDIALIGYEGSSAFNLWADKLSGRDVVPIPEIIQNPLGTLSRTEQKADPIEGVIEVKREYNYWFEPKAGGGTPMGQALTKARHIIEAWLQHETHRDSFPPVVIHITDGVPNQTERQMASDEANAIKSLSTSDGNALLITIHVPDGYGQTLLFPLSPADLPAGDASAELLYQMASVLPNELIETTGTLNVRPGARLMIMNADAMAVKELVTWGTSTSGATRPD